MTLKVQKWGNSLAIRIPRGVAKEAHIREGTTVEIVGDAQSVVMRLPKPPKYSLKELLDKVTPENIHPEVDWGPPVGKERFWEEE